MKPMINLPFGESLKRTYLYVFANFGKAMKICSFWIVLMLAADGCPFRPSVGKGRIVSAGRAMSPCCCR